MLVLKKGSPCDEDTARRCNFEGGKKKRRQQKQRAVKNYRDFCLRKIKEAKKKAASAALV